jgi:hypothetical protein
LVNLVLIPKKNNTKKPCINPEDIDKIYSNLDEEYLNEDNGNEDNYSHFFL